MSDYLDRALALSSAATPGPLELGGFDSGHSKFEMSRFVCTQDVGDIVCDLDGLSRVNNERHAKDDGGADGALIVFAWDFVPKAASALREVEGLVEFLESGEMEVGAGEQFVAGERDCASRTAARLRAILVGLTGGGVPSS